MAVLVAGLAGVVVVRSGPDHPDEWDPRVLDLVRFVERERGLEFRHPVHVEFLTRDEFAEEMTEDPSDVTAEDEEELEAIAAVFRALGLLEGDVDLFEEVNELTAQGTLGFYDYDRRRIVVAGTELTVGHEVTLVHELTHALQDQRFDLSLLDEAETSGQESAYLALVEGDAVRIESGYLETLDDDELAEYEEELGGDIEEFEEEEFPSILVTLFAAPYDLGELLVLLLESEGEEAIDEAFAEPPTTDEHLLDPWTFVEGDDALEVPVPDLEDGEDPVELGGIASGDLGALTWYLLLAERIDPHRALGAVDGWGGDAYVTFERDGRTCVRASFRGDRQRDTREMADALEDWAASMPPGATSVARGDDVVTFTSCDPGTEATAAGSGASENALLLPLTRTGISLGAVQEGAPRRVARCVAARIVDGLSLDQLVELLESETAPPVIEEQAAAAFEACL